MIDRIEDGSIEVSGEALDELEYADVRVEGHEAATVNVKDDEVEVLVFDPNDPTDSVAEFRFDRPEMSAEEKMARAEAEAEREAQRRFERHLDRGGHLPGGPGRNP